MWVRRRVRVEPESNAQYLKELFQGGNGSLTGGKRRKHLKVERGSGRTVKKKKGLSEALPRSICFKRRFVDSVRK